MSQWHEILAAGYSGDAAGPSLDVVLIGEEERVDLRLRGETLRAGSPTLDAVPDLTIHLSEISPRDALLGRTSSLSLFEDARIEVAEGRRRISPWSETQIPTGSDFEPIPEATLAIAMHVTGCLAGEVGLIEDWRDGVLRSTRLVPVQQLSQTDADVRVSTSLSQLASLRRREITPLDAIAQGLGLFGEWPHLMCWAELVQHPAYMAAWPEDPTLEAEARWGAVFCSSEYGDAATRALIERPISDSVA